MTLHYRLNAKWGDPADIEGLVVEDGDIFEECNFANATATGMIFGATKNLVFIRCNLANCVYHPTSRVMQCQVGNYDYCAHILEHLGLPPEPDNCRHVDSVDDSDPENPVYERSTNFLGRRSDVSMTDEEVTEVLAPYNEIRKDRNGWQRWATYGE